MILSFQLVLTFREANFKQLNKFSRHATFTAWSLQPLVFVVHRQFACCIVPHMHDGSFSNHIFLLGHCRPGISGSLEVFFTITFAPFSLFCPTRSDASAEVLGGPASPLAVQVSDINKNYVFLTWQPPSADGSSNVEGYYVEK